ncbi:hypothetical protein POTOM_026464 [Populus tomentosa]|uniref:Uncharacterized protein n=1 Tax=Populus tomentosa TaxID=118781 RepID=A0A8X7ZXC1_POPTO|nr:hypothetical protein POTOM_026464 [Populus tomentosa]
MRVRVTEWCRVCYTVVHYWYYGVSVRNYIAVDQPRRKHTVKVHVSTENVATNGTLAFQQEEARRAKFSRMSRCSLFRDLLSIMGGSVMNLTGNSPLSIVGWAF